MALSMKKEFTSDILSRLKDVEYFLKILELHDVNIKIAISVKEIEFEPTDAVYKGVLSLLTAEQYKLKQKLKESLDLVDVEKMDFE